MRWGDGDIEFVRPVHWVLLLFGEDIIHATILGMETGRDTRGHRFHHPEAISMASAGEYLTQVAERGTRYSRFQREKKTNQGSRN